MRDIYIVATLSDTPVDFASIDEELDDDDLLFSDDEGRWSFRYESSSGPVEVRFEAREEALGETPELLSGHVANLDILRRAKGFYRISFPTHDAHPPLIVVEALVLARVLLGATEGVLLDISSFKVHGEQDVEEIIDLDFDIRDHLSIHVQQLTDGDSPLWVHTHGMEKFGVRDVELFHISEDELDAAEGFLHELCGDMAMGQAPEPGSMMGTSEGHMFRLDPSEEARPRLIGVPLASFEGHEGPFLTVVSSEGRHTAGELLRPYRDRFEDEAPALSEALQATATKLLPKFRSRFMRRGLMEPLTFLVRATFETHPEGTPEGEDLWAEVLTWDEETMVGRLVDGSRRTTEWRKGATVEIAEAQVNAVVVTREGRPLDEEDLGHLLESELPS